MKATSSLAGMLLMACLDLMRVATTGAQTFTTLYSFVRIFSFRELDGRVCFT